MCDERIGARQRSRALGRRVRRFRVAVDSRSRESKRGSRADESARRGCRGRPRGGRVRDPRRRGTHRARGFGRNDRPAHLEDLRASSRVRLSHAPGTQARRVRVRKRRDGLLLHRRRGRSGGEGVRGQRRERQQRAIEPHQQPDEPARRSRLLAVHPADTSRLPGADRSPLPAVPRGLGERRGGRRARQLRAVARPRRELPPVRRGRHGDEGKATRERVDALRARAEVGRRPNSRRRRRRSSRERIRVGASKVGRRERRSVRRGARPPNYAHVPDADARADVRLRNARLALAALAEWIPTRTAERQPR